MIAEPQPQPQMGGGTEPGVDRPFHDPAPGVRRQVRLEVAHMDEVRARHDEIEAVLAQAEGLEQEAQRLIQRAAAQRRMAEHLAQGLMRWLTMEYALPMERGEEWLLDIYHMVINEASPVNLPPAPDPLMASPEAQAEALERLEPPAQTPPEEPPVSAPVPDAQAQTTTPTPTPTQQRRARKRAAPGGKREAQP